MRFPAAPARERDADKKNVDKKNGDNEYPVFLDTVIGALV
jgi:hypothetical protein